MKFASLRLILVAVTAVAALNCSSSGDDGDDSSSDLTDTEYVDCNDIAGIPGLLPKDPTLTDLENVGRCTWVLSTGRTTENPKFATTDKSGKPVPGGLGGSENLLSDANKKNGTFVPLPLLFVATSEADRVARWKKFGTMNDPGCTASAKPDEFGVQLDTCKDPFSAGVIGFRKFKNPKFDPTKWDVKKYPTTKTMEPPYLVGLTCGGCHTSFNPAKPPADPAHPTWDNLVYTIGNQYLAEGELFKPAFSGPSDFKWQVLDTQERGTSDTSRVSSDHINNPNAINSIYNLAFRPWHGEQLKAGQTTFDLTKVDLGALNKMTFDEASKALSPITVKTTGETHPVQSILKGGEDSVGPVGALLRVYVNIGMCSAQWLTHFDPVNGNGGQTSITPTEMYDNCPSYLQMLSKVPAMFLFLAKQGPIHLADAPDGASLIDQSLVTAGKTVFADNCATCHSGKQPPDGTADTTQWFRDEVLKDDFLEGNYLSDDKSYPVTSIGTNAARALHTNHMKGHIWADSYASQTYADRKFPGPITVKNPWGDDLQFTGPDGGPGYYRTPSLVSIWSRAPFLHNKALGTYNGDPSVKGRLAAYEDAATKLLNPDKRGAGFIKRTAVDSVLDLDLLGLKIHVPKGTPINLLANLDPNTLSVKMSLLGSAVGDFFGASFDPAAPTITGTPHGQELMTLSLCPDFVEDRGHTFGSTLSDDDKKALIEFMKTL